jgi:hypothetical protein
MRKGGWGVREWGSGGTDSSICDVESKAFITSVLPALVVEQHFC